MLYLNRTLALSLLCISTLSYGNEVDLKQVLKEIQTIKQQLAEMDKLKARLNELETQVQSQQPLNTKQQSSESQPQSKKLPPQIVKAEVKEQEKSVQLGGSLRMHYRIKDWDDAGKSKGGDLRFGLFNITAKAKHDKWSALVDYRWYGYMDTIRLGYINYKINNQLDFRFGMPRKPFGIAPYSSNSWWFGLPYYVGLTDDIDLGGKLMYRNGPWDLQLGFFKNGEWADPSRTERYSIDVIKDSEQQQYNEETNQLNGRIAYHMTFSDRHKIEIGLSGEWGQLYNSETDDMGDHWAIGAHLEQAYGPFNLQLQAMKYRYNPENPTGVSNDQVLVGAFADSYFMASQANLFEANLSYSYPVSMGPVTKLKFYNDFSIIDKEKNDYNDTVVNTLGMAVSAGAVSANIDFVMGKNAIWLNGLNHPMAEGEKNADWNYLFNINLGYYY